MSEQPQASSAADCSIHVHRYIQQLGEGTERCYQLDIVGAKVLRNAGFTQIAPTHPLMPRARPGVLLANRLGTSMILGAHHDPQVTGVPLLLRPQHVRLLTRRRCGRGVIAPVAQQPDLSYWKTAEPPSAIASWNRIVGVVSRLGATRSLRYVLSAATERNERI